MFILQLNLMRGRAEECRQLAIAETKEALEQFVDSERVEPYMDGQWSKSFRKDGPLEWYNPPIGDGLFFENFVNIGSEDDWASNARAQYRQLVGELRRV